MPQKSIYKVYPNEKETLAVSAWYQIPKVKRTSSVFDASRSVTPKMATDRGASTEVLAMARNPTKATRCLSAQMGINQSSAMRNLRANKWHPYKLTTSDTGILTVGQSSVSGN
ncbi:hypothetical protein AVEN_234353-1 [Araneus ventricosus]|uniref:Uncharacterized protein n=1 Tax=Araneus ventricosus TaxID=182803 RepID=A0A4Y2A860_ARAVE|nr:hypothetical protein AVEN_234353-1 [Araneus ventricosus]